MVNEYTRVNVQTQSQNPSRITGSWSGPFRYATQSGTLTEEMYEKVRRRLQETPQEGRLEFPHPVHGDTSVVVSWKENLYG